MTKRILIATGGTGGHVYPAIALAQQFATRQMGSKVLFVGGRLVYNRYFDHQAFEYRSIDCGAFTSKSPLALARSFLNITKGIRQSCKIIQEFKPDVVVGFGSYYSFPPLIAAKWQSVPIVLHEANSIPGKVNKLLAPFANATGVHFPKTRDLLKGVTHEVGMPLRQGFEKGRIDAMCAKSYFGIDNDQKKVLLAFGGSQGANVINKHVLEAMGLLNNFDSIHVIHIVGEQQYVKPFLERYEKIGISACVKAFEERMDYAWRVADFVISRAGASSIAEQLEFEVPGILIPFEKAADDHQNYNADFLAETVGGAKKILEKDLNAETLARLIAENFADGKMDQMKNAMVEYKRCSRTKDLFWLVANTQPVKF
jgi:UDP-N-acetylglucosamine--N-acetylmuramyl-(pentapeptide) pyrophosphoryl-undecaprenol N-acetylglucosamine transferase